MPRYKVKAFDGKTLTIDAEDEAALDEAMQEYEGQAKPQEAPAPSALDRAGQGALAGAVPGYSTYKTATQGGSGTDIASAAAGDVANLAMLGIGGPAKLASSTALGGAIGAAGGALQPVAQGIGRAVGDVAAKMSPLSYIPPQASDSAWNPLNLLREVPRTLGETVGELAPQAALLALTGRLAKGAAKGPAPLPEAAVALAAEGGQPTAAMRATSPFGRVALGAVERSARINPLLGSKFEGIDQANAQAASNIAKKSFGADVMEPGLGARAGQELQTSLERLANQRSEGYKGALGEMAGKLEAVKSPAEGIKAAKKMGPTMATAIEAAQAEALPSVARMFDGVKAKLASGKLTPKQIELELQDLRHQFDAQYAQLNQANPGAFGAADRSFGIIDKAMRNAYYDGLNKVSKGMGDVLREAKGDYAQASEGMNPLTRALSAKGGNAPEMAAAKLMESGTESLKALKETMMPEDWANTRQQIAKTIMAQTIDKDGGISASRLKAKLNSNPKIREIIPIVFDSGTELADMNKLIKIMETAQQNELGRVNPSGSGTLVAQGAQLVGAGASIFNPALLGPLAGKMGIDAAYTYGAVPAQNALRTAQTAIAPAAASLAKRGNNAMANAALATTRAQQDNRLRPRFIQALNQ